MQNQNIQFVSIECSETVTVTPWREIEQRFMWMEEFYSVP